ncbi:Uncharacterised protein [Bordetella trematum]|nr:Uncharacterised protein [Bordetella trematum]
MSFCKRAKSLEAPAVALIRKSVCLPDGAHGVMDIGYYASGIA